MINKTRNVNLQLTISKSANEKLLKIQNDLSAILSLNLSKSQTIEYLINKYQIQAQQQDTEKEQARNKTSAQINALKDKLNISYPKLAEIIKISLTTLKRYAYGEQEPSGENKILLEKALKQYDIKI